MTCRSRKFFLHYTPVTDSLVTHLYSWLQLWAKVHGVGNAAMVVNERTMKEFFFLTLPCHIPSLDCCNCCRFLCTRRGILATWCAVLPLLRPPPSPNHTLLSHIAAPEELVVGNQELLLQLSGQAPQTVPRCTFLHPIGCNKTLISLSSWKESSIAVI